MSAAALGIVSALSYQRMGEQLVDALGVLGRQKFRKPGLAAKTLISLWNGTHNTTAWDNLK
jgi:hypothetical protein